MMNVVVFTTKKTHECYKNNLFEYKSRDHFNE